MGPSGPRSETDDDRFEILEELGRGAGGVVYRAVEPSTGREVALKVLLGRPDATRLARFEREGKVTAGLNHPGIVRVHAAGTFGRRPFLAYELVPGRETFGDAQQRLSRPARLQLLRDAADAVAHAHARGVVHRDLKPANLLVDRASGDVPRVRVADFGMAHLTGDAQDRLTRSGVIVGTPHYMAPEQASGQREVGAPADVWALGVMLYEALTDRLPFDGDSLQVLLARICSGSLVPPRQHDPTIPRPLEAVVLRALECDLAGRYPDACALAADLDAFLRGEPVAAQRRMVLGSLRRRRGLLLALGAGALAVAAALLTAARLLRPVPDPSVVEPAVDPAPRVTVLAPADGAALDEASAAFEVRVDDADDKFVDLQVGPRNTRVRAGQAFTTRVELALGRNVVTIAARDAAGHEARAERHLLVTATPAWWAQLPVERRPGLPLSAGLGFGGARGEYVNERDDSVLVWVPPGRFSMGTSQPSEGPPHEVHLTRGVFMAKFEVTWGQYRRFCSETRRRAPELPSYPITDEHPLVGVEVEDCLAYCAWAGLRLPTEAEWEWAARGGDGRVFPWGDVLPAAHHANLTRDRFDHAAPVGSFPAGGSPWGCLDMAGNVCEWVADRFAPYPSEPQQDPCVAASPGDLRAVRGGCFGVPDYLARATGRTEGWRSELQGFRAARSP